MRPRPTAPARLPPPGITGLDARWSRLVHAPHIDGVGRTWHLLDSWATRDPKVNPELTLLCVHGNPSWSFLWRHLLARSEEALNDRVRVIAIDQLEMGFSERTGQKRNLATRIDDLYQLSIALALHGPVVTVAHDWGGPVSLGWAQQQLARRQGPTQPDSARHDPPPFDAPEPGERSAAPFLAGVVLTNTAVHQPEHASAPLLIRLVRSPLVLQAATIRTTAFIRGAIEMSRPRLSGEVRAGFMAPWQQAEQRTGIADFVADIPLDPAHESAAVLAEVATGVADLHHVPALLLWGPRDRVFSDLYLHDLERRLPHAQVHRFPTAAHLVTEDADVAGAIVEWLDQQVLPAARPGTQPAAMPSANRRALADFSTVSYERTAVTEIAPRRRNITFGELAGRVDAVAAGMGAFGIRKHERIAVMITPGIDLVLTVYACWRFGATLVLVDSGLGRTGMQNALRSANPDWLIGIDKALIAATLLGWPGRRIATAPRSALATRALGIRTDLVALEALGRSSGTPVEPAVFPEPEAVAAVAFTSGSTGPSKGVIYRHHQIQAQRDALIALYEITGEDRLVAAFAPFALYGPTMGITSMVPDMDVTAPRTLTATALMAATESIDATLVFASPAALVNVVATGASVVSGKRPSGEAVRLVLSAGAPVRATLLRQASELFPNAAFRTPYGMTEVLPVADISLSELETTIEAEQCTDTSSDPAEARQRADKPGTRAQASSGHPGGNRHARSAVTGKGVCVGHPLPETEILVDPLNGLGMPIDAPSATPGVLGEILIRAAHARAGYDRLWLTDHRASQPNGWHRSGDIGQLDTAGRLWVGGRLGHVITTVAGPVAPVASEQRIETLNEVAMAAVVGVGPPGTQGIVAVIQPIDPDHPCPEVSLELIDKVRAAATCAVDIVAVLAARQLPVDRRHNSKIDRTTIALWAERALAGERAGTL